MAMTVASSQLGSTARGPHEGAFRPPAVGVRGVVSSAHGLASQAGVRALMLGGNAVDAAVAVAATLAVVEPFMSGLGGGGGYMLIRDAKSGQIHGLDYLGRAPRAARGDAWTDQEAVYDDVRAACQPSAVAGWLAALERFGKLDRATVFSFAIEIAERGWPITAFAASMLTSQQARLGRFASSRAAYYPNGTIPRVGELVPQPGMARSLRTIAEGGADVYYRGELGEQITRAIQEAGGWMTMDDLADVQAALAGAAGDPVSRQHRHDDAAGVLRHPVPRIDADPRGVRPGGARPQLRRIPSPAARSDQARQRRPRGVHDGHERRPPEPACRRRTSQTAGR